MTPSLNFKRLMIVIIGFVFLAGIIPDYSSAQNTTLTVNYVCTEINAGYDYEFKIKLYIDGSYIGESSPRISSSPNQATFSVPAGYHTVKIIGLKNYQGTWEESLKSNNYSVDSKVEQTVNISGPTVIDIVFKMSSGTEVKSIRSTGVSTSSHSSGTTALTVNYVCTEINAGYDYEFKIKLYVDGSYIGESSPRISSSPNQATFTVPAGQRYIKIIGLKNYQGNWEESLKSNNYSVDSKVEQTVNISGPTAIDIVFKMSSGTEVKSITSVSGSSAGGESQPQTPFKIR